LAAWYGISRKFVYRQTHKARTALDDAFMAATPEDEVLFQLTVAKTWLRRVIVGLALIGHSSYRGIVAFLAGCGHWRRTHPSKQTRLQVSLSAG